MANKTYQVKIESILGGISPMSDFASEGQCYDLFSVDPSLGLLSGVPSLYIKSSGLIVPTVTSISSNVDSLASAGLWMVSNPKNSYIYVYDFVGSVYTNSGNILSGLGDLNDGGTSIGNGASYYDNYIYFSRSTTVARYGPLDGTPSFTDDYWVGTLAKTALSNTTYPVVQSTYANINMPNHFLHRHSDGRLYIADVVGNKGAIHYVQTTKTTVEGDTDNGSTYNALEFGYGLWPTAITSYGDSIVVALFEGISTNKFRQSNAKIAIWDTVSTSYNSITWLEFPDNLVTSIINVNGTLYFVSGDQTNEGFRLSKYLGGDTFQEVSFFGDGYLPLPGATLSIGESLLFGSYSRSSALPTIYRKKLRANSISDGVFKLGAATSPSNGMVTAISTYPDLNSTALGSLPAFCTADTNTNTYKMGYINVGSSTTEVYAVFTSEVFRVGSKFKITKISIPVSKSLPSTAGGSVRVYVDNFSSSYSVLSSISGYSGQKRIVIRPKGCVGENNFVLQFTFTSSNYAVGLPVIIEYEVIDE